MSKQNRQIDELNATVKVKIAPSEIHGIGVFAIRDLEKGEKVYCFPSGQPHWYSIPFKSLGKLFPEIKELVLQRWGSIVNGSNFHSPNDDQWLILFMNHSDEPNYDKAIDCVNKGVKKGEEITSDYREMDNYEEVFTWLT